MTMKREDLEAAGRAAGEEFALDERLDLDWTKWNAARAKAHEQAAHAHEQAAHAHVQIERSGGDGSTADTFTQAALAHRMSKDAERLTHEIGGATTGTRWTDLPTQAEVLSSKGRHAESAFLHTQIAKLHRDVAAKVRQNLAPWIPPRSPGGAPGSAEHQSALAKRVDEQRRSVRLAADNDGWGDRV